MPNFTNILVIADQDDNQVSAIRKGFEFASISAANLDIVSFCFANLSGAPTPGDMAPGDVQRLILDNKNAQLQDAIATLRAQFPQLAAREISAEVVWEKQLPEWITQRMIDQPYDLLIKTGHRSESPLYTPTDWHLMREAPAPVYLVSERAWKAKRRVLVALDIESKHTEKQQLNLRLLEEGRILADVLDAELDCCFVVHVPGLLREFDVIDISTYTRRARETYLPRVIELAKPFAIRAHNIHRAAGNPSREILKFSNRFKPSCVVIGSMGRHGVAGKLIGNTAEQVIKSLHTDMLVVNNA